MYMNINDIRLKWTFRFGRRAVPERTSANAGEHCKRKRRTHFHLTNLLLYTLFGMGRTSIGIFCGWLVAATVIWFFGMADEEKQEDAKTDDAAESLCFLIHLESFNSPEKFTSVIFFSFSQILIPITTIMRRCILKITWNLERLMYVLRVQV